MNERSPRLDLDSCRKRQAKFCALLVDLELDSAITCNRHYVHALTGYWHEQPLTPVAAFVDIDGRATLISPGPAPESAAIDDHRRYEAQKCCTLVENITGELSEAALDLVRHSSRLGTTDCAWPWFLGTAWVDITTAYQYFRRAKLPDEIAMVQYAIAAAETVYQRAATLLHEGIDEVHLYAQLLATATEALGEPLSGWGQDFQIGTPGGFPRSRQAQAGELAILDIGVGYRGYRCDLSRTFAVSGEATDRQAAAHGRILEAFQHIESQLAPQLECHQLYDEVREMLDGWHGYRFFHHLGHGIGLDAHEVPRLNPNWDDHLMCGDVIAVEPGLYGEPLRGGIRLEQNYQITEDGMVRLSSFPLDLVGHS